MISSYNEESPLATEVRRISSKLRITAVEKKLKCFMVTSASLGEGKSTAAAYLAIACSKYRGTSTVLVDFDMRRPRVHSLFKTRQRKGIADVLIGTRALKSCLKPSGFDNLQILTSGRLRDDNPTALLNSRNLEGLFAELRFYFDIVIVDAPPVIPVADPLMLSSEIDGALFVIKAGKTQKPVIKRALSLLKDARIDTLGVIVNNMHHVLPYYYDYDFYDYEYYRHGQNGRQKR